MPIDRLHMDGRPRFAKLSIVTGRQVEIAAMDPDSDRGRNLGSLMEYAGQLPIKRSHSKCFV